MAEITSGYRLTSKVYELINVLAIFFELKLAKIRVPAQIMIPELAENLVSTNKILPVLPITRVPRQIPVVTVFFDFWSYFLN